MTKMWLGSTKATSIAKPAITHEIVSRAAPGAFPATTAAQSAAVPAAQHWLESHLMGYDGMGLDDPLTELWRETTFVGMPDFDPPGPRATTKATGRS